MKDQFEASMFSNAKRKDVPIEELKLDFGNVRLAHLSLRDKFSDDKVEKILWDDPDIDGLYDQILFSKGITEPIVVTSNYVVVEGNRRLACLRKLNSQAKAGDLPGVSKSEFSKVPCLVLTPDAKDPEKDIYLAMVHVKGKQPWKLFNRAKHVYTLYMVHKLSYDKIARAARMGKPTVKRNIEVYREIIKYQARYTDDGEWVHKFTYFDELFKRKDLKEWRETEGSLKLFAGWVHGKKFRDVRDVRKLYLVLSDEEAFKAFKEHNFDRAMKVLERNDPSLTDNYFKKIKSTLEIIRTTSRSKLEEIVKNPEEFKLLNSLSAELENLMMDLKSKRKAMEGRKK